MLCRLLKSFTAVLRTIVKWSKLWKNNFVLNNFFQKNSVFKMFNNVSNILAKDICRLPSETGRCRAAFQRYFYDHNDGQCKQFIYGGCEGNENNFETIEACESQCNRQCKCIHSSLIKHFQYFPCWFFSTFQWKITILLWSQRWF